MTPDKKGENILAALGAVKSDLVIKGANVFNAFTETFERNDIAIKNGIIVGIGENDAENTVDASGKYAVPSFIDAHMHLESSVISPPRYAEATAPHGTGAVIADPHEIANVLGVNGVKYMLEISHGLPVDMYFTVPSCVPATAFDESGASLSVLDAEALMHEPRVLGLAEMMNYPSVISADREVLEKIISAEHFGKAVDGHAPSLSGKELCAYVTAGVRSDHECTELGEAKEKISKGQWVMVREGTACKNLEALMPLFEPPYCYRTMLVTDDKHPGELCSEGHIDHIVRRAIALGAKPELAFKMASFNPAVYFGLRDIGALAPGYSADIVLLDDVNTVKISAVYKRGVEVGKLISEINFDAPIFDALSNSVKVGAVSEKLFEIKKKREKIIELVKGEILTRDGGYAEKADPERGICKVSVIERHHATGHVGTAYLSGYGLRFGAVATTVAHDSHNIIVAGASDSDMAFAVERLKCIGGGMVVVSGGKVLSELALPIAGLMCELSAREAEQRLASLKSAAYGLGVSRDIDPFMTLSFASLPVIPALRITTLGVFDVRSFKLL